MEFMREVRLSDVRASVTIVHVRRFLKFVKTSLDLDSFLKYLKGLF